MKSLSILLVDDDTSVRITVGKLLSKASHRVTAAASLREALQFLDRAEFDVVLTDMLLGESDGLEVLKAANTKQPGARVVVMSGGGALLKASYCLNLAGAFGAEAQLRKPFNYAELLAAVEEVATLEPAAR